jgi:hypothetical protein
MKKLHFAGLIVAIVVASVQASAAVILYPWCVVYGSIASGTLNCGFTSFKQCLLTASGNGSNCIPNPQYPNYPPSPRFAPPIRR